MTVSEINYPLAETGFSSNSTDPKCVVSSEVPLLRPQAKEDILAIPRIWTKRAYQLLVQHNAVPRPWNLEGRWGSRTHKIDEQRMGFPIISRCNLEEIAAKEQSIRELLEVDGVEILNDQPYFSSHRARDPIFHDATIHPQRQPQGYNVPTNRRSNITKQLFPTDVQRDQQRLFTYAELFAGIGGFGVALEALGGKCVFVSELQDNCRETYQTNFDTPADCIYCDIYEVNDSQFPRPGTLDLLV